MEKVLANFDYPEVQLIEEEQENSMIGGFTSALHGSLAVLCYRFEHMD